MTPLIAVAPLLLIYLDARGAVLACAFLVAFFPILSNASAGLKTTERGLVELFRLKGASGGKILLWLRLPSALPQIFIGLRIGGGLALSAPWRPSWRRARPGAAKAWPSESPRRAIA